MSGPPVVSLIRRPRSARRASHPTGTGPGRDREREGPQENEGRVVAHRTWATSSAKGNVVGMARVRTTEMDACHWIHDKLDDLGWVVKNPDRVPEGQVYTQNECLGHPEIGKYLGHQKPEYVVKLSESRFWVIEAKRERDMIDRALGEAEGYADDINNSQSIAAIIISGVAGNDGDKYVVRSRFLEEKKFRPITLDGMETTALLSPEMCEILLTTQRADIEDIPIDESLFLRTAENINSILHRGAINQKQRARVIAALLLSRVGKTGPNIDADLLVLIGDINNRAKSVLKENKKGEFFPCVEIMPPTNSENHKKFRKAIVDTLQELDNLNIRSAMKSGTDVLGQFYEVFLKYGNGAKEIGIVLTPRHVTRFAVEALNVTAQDIVYDPMCGTGGFLVAAFDQVRQQATGIQFERFRKYNLLGVEQEPEVAALAIVNMIFRNDGKNNIIEADCFNKYPIPKSINGHASATYSTTPADEGTEPVTKVLMNPPMAQEEKEYTFLQAGLDSLAHGGLLFSVLPISTMFEDGKPKEWRETRLLGENTLLGVVTFPPELFYPVGKHTLGVFVRKGIPHPEGQGVFWARAMHDGFVKLKGKRLPAQPPGSEPNDLETLLPDLRAFLANPSHPAPNIPEFQKVAPIDLSDPLLELVPEAYLDGPPIDPESLISDMERLVREQAAFIIRFQREAEYAD